MADRVGQQFGNYRLVRLLGQGGFAEVYLGEHLQLGTQAAIKLLHTHIANEDVELFRKEARTIAHLIHPHIVRVFDFGVEGTIPFLVMDHATGGTVRKLYPRGIALPLPTIVTYTTQTAEALQYAHDAHVIHRDIKPENLLLGRRQEVLLSDFGIAQLAQNSRSQSIQDVAGTAAYMAPEQFQGKPRPASDQYAIGVMVYEWLCGERPFHGSFTEVASQHLFVPPPPLQEKVPTISAAIEHVVLTALAKDPKQRFDSVLAFATALEQACQSTWASPSDLPRVVTSSNQPSPLTDVQTPASQASQATSSVPSLSPSVLPTLSTESSRPAELVTPPSQFAPPTELIRSPEPGQPTAMSTPSYPTVDPPNVRTLMGQAAQLPVTTTPLSRLAPQPTSLSSGVPSIPKHGVSRRTMVLGLGLAGLAAAGGGLVWLASSHGLFAPFASSQTAPPASQRTPPPTPRPTPTPLPLGTLLYTYRGHSSEADAVAWSPDGKRIASGSYDDTVQVWDAADGGHVFTYHGHTSVVFGVAWSPNGKRIASCGGSPDATVHIWDAADGGHVFTYHGHSSHVYTAVWSPDGKRIASASIDGTVQVWDAVDGGNVSIYQGHSGQVSAAAWSPDGKRIASAGAIDKTVQVWDAAGGGHVYIYRGHTQDGPTWVAWSPDGKRIASSGGDMTVQVWDAVDGGHVYIYRGHPDVVYRAEWSPDGKRIASTGYDGVQVWDAVDGGHVYIYRGHSGIVWAVAWSPDGKRIASGGNEGTVQVWVAE